MTAPITPDERAAMRALADAATEGPWKVVGPSNPGPDNDLAIVPLGEAGAVAYVQPLWADAELIAAARTAVPRLLDALDTAEAEAEAAQRRHNTAFESVRTSVREYARAAEAWEAQTYAALAQRDKALADVALLRPALVQWEEGFAEETDRLDALVERQRDRLSAREEQVRRLRAEVTRLHALVADLRAAQPAPVWDENTVIEAAAQHGFDVAAAKHGSDRYTNEQRRWATISEDEREMVRTMITAALTVVQKHLPVRPSRKALSDLLLTFLSPPKYKGASWTYNPDKAADAVLALLSGEPQNTDGEEASDTNGPVPTTKDALLEHLSALYDRIDSASGLDPALRLELRSAVADTGLAVERLAAPVKESTA